MTLVRPSATSDGGVTARLAGPRLPAAAHHVAAILLTDAATGKPISIDYRSQTSVRRDAAGRIAAIHVAIPRATSLPRRIRAYVVVDAFPIAARQL